LHNNGIRTREQLAQHTRMSRATIYRVFAADWSGTATLTALVRMAYCLRVPLAALVKEPARGLMNCRAAPHTHVAELEAEIARRTQKATHQ
jgi:hypothetical protein